VTRAFEIPTRHWWRRRIPLYASGLAAAAAVDAITPLAIADWLVEIALVYVAATRGGRLETILVALAGTGCTIAGLWTSPADGVPVWMGVLNRMAAIGIIWLIVHLARKRSLAEVQIKVLRGLLPICASCKRIRHGDDQWQNLESYISVHSEATFTHTLCPGCFEKYHAEIHRN